MKPGDVSFKLQRRGFDFLQETFQGDDEGRVSKIQSPVTLYTQEETMDS